MLYLIARLAQAVSTLRRLSWLTKMILAQKAPLTAAERDSMDWAVSNTCYWQLVPSSASVNSVFCFSKASPYCLSSSAASSPISSTSDSFLKRASISFYSQLARMIELGEPKFEVVNSMKAFTDSCLKPSNM